MPGFLILGRLIPIPRIIRFTLSCAALTSVYLAISVQMRASIHGRKCVVCVGSLEKVGKGHAVWIGLQALQPTLTGPGPAKPRIASVAPARQAINARLRALWPAAGSHAKLGLGTASAKELASHPADFPSLALSPVQHALSQLGPGGCRRGLPLQTSSRANPCGPLDSRFSRAYSNVVSRPGLPFAITRPGFHLRAKYSNQHRSRQQSCWPLEHQYLFLGTCR